MLLPPYCMSHPVARCHHHQPSPASSSWCGCTGLIMLFCKGKTFTTVAESCAYDAALSNSHAFSPCSRKQPPLDFVKGETNLWTVLFLHCLTNAWPFCGCEFPTAQQHALTFVTHTLESKNVYPLIKELKDSHATVCLFTTFPRYRMDNIVTFNGSDMLYSRMRRCKAKAFVPCYI